MPTTEARKSGQHKSPQPKSVNISSDGHTKLQSLIPDGMRDALAFILHDAQIKWKSENERREAETRAFLAEFARDALEFKAVLKDRLETELKEIREQVGKLRDGKDADEDVIVERVTKNVSTLTDNVRNLVSTAFEHKLRDVIRLELSMMKKELRGDPGPQGEPGRDGIDGKDGKDGIDGEPGCDGVDGEPGRDGIDGSPGSAGERGADGSDGRDGVDGETGPAGERGADGVGISELLINSEDVLVVALTDGRTKEVGRVVGKDGQAGRDGRDGAPGGPPGPPGPEGPSGKDGTSVYDAGTWTQSEIYPKGAGATFGGSWWISQKDDNNEKPGTGNAWRLAVKKGRDGKDGKSA